MVLLFFSVFFLGLCSSQNCFCRAPFRFECFILWLFLWPSSAQLLLLYCYLAVLLHLAFHRAPFILNASFWVFFIHFFYSIFYGFFFGFWKLFCQVLFHGCGVLFEGYLSPRTDAFSGCCFGLFCPVLLGFLFVCLFLALRRAPISSNWFFIWHSFGTASTQLLVRNHSFFVVVLFDTWLGSFFFRVLLFKDCASVFHHAFLLSCSVLSSGL